MFGLPEIEDSKIIELRVDLANEIRFWTTQVDQNESDPVFQSYAKGRLEQCKNIVSKLDGSWPKGCCSDEK